MKTKIFFILFFNFINLIKCAENAPMLEINLPKIQITGIFKIQGEDCTLSYSKICNSFYRSNSCLVNVTYSQLVITVNDNIYNVYENEQLNNQINDPLITRLRSLCMKVPLNKFVKFKCRKPIFSNIVVKNKYLRCLDQRFIMNLNLTLSNDIGNSHTREYWIEKLFNAYSRVNNFSCIIL